MGKKGGAGGKAKQSSLLNGGFDFEKYPQLKKPTCGVFVRTCPMPQRQLGYVSLYLPSVVRRCNSLSLIM